MGSFQCSVWICKPLKTEYRTLKTQREILLVNEKQIRRLGLLGGTFDPPHYGHLWLAETARVQLQLDLVLFLPVGDPVHKDDGITAVSHRTTMTQLAIQNHPHFQLDTTDIDRPPPHTTVSLIPLLQAKYPNAQIWWLIGGDSLRDLPTWVKPQTLIQRCRLAALPRPGTTIDWEPLVEAIPQIKERVDLLNGPVNALSSTAIRSWVKKGNSIRFLTDTAVIDYIHTHKLYR